MPDVTIYEFERLLRQVRGVFSRRSIVIGVDSELSHLLTEVDLFVARSRDIPAGTTDNATDEHAVRVGYPPLCFWHLADAVVTLDTGNVPKIKQTLESVASLRHGDDDQEEQFYDAAYELVSATDFHRGGLRPSFIDTRQRSRYQKRVEYLLLHKWPVECKRPRSLETVVRQAKRAREKIDERSSPGIICISLDHALSDRATFRDYDSIHDLQCEASQALDGYLANARDQLILEGTSQHAVAVLFHLELLGYIHDTERISGPLLRCAITSEGKMLSTDVVQKLRQVLQAAKEKPEK